MHTACASSWRIIDSDRDPVCKLWNLSFALGIMNDDGYMYA